MNYHFTVKSLPPFFAPHETSSLRETCAGGENHSKLKDGKGASFLFCFVLLNNTEDRAPTAGASFAFQKASFPS
jgi:hypothetical protein